MKRFVYMISDGTGITAESLGNSLLSQFEHVEIEKQTIPYVDTIEKAQDVINQINESFYETGLKPLVFLTLINPKLNQEIKNAHGCVIDLFSTFLSPLEHELGLKSSYQVGKTHGVANVSTYNRRIEAINYTLAHDDGVKISGYGNADIILVGVSRTGKTPSCLYMALQFGILAANYPFTEDDLSYLKLPEPLRPYKDKLFGLTIDSMRLHQIRSERRPGSQYASLEQCQKEVREIESMYKKEKIPCINSTHYSIEEIVTKIMSQSGLKRRL